VDVGAAQIFDRREEQTGRALGRTTSHSRGRSLGAGQVLSGWSGHGER
jgi:hypothetical protein